jgi:hypothetical protein
VQFPADSLFGALIFLDTTARWPVKDSAGLRIFDFRNKECIFVPHQAEGGLSGLDFHVLCSLYRLILRFRMPRVHSPGKSIRRAAQCVVR